MKKLIILVFFVAILASCAKTDETPQLISNSHQIQLAIGDQTEVTTRSAATTEECFITDAFILVFGTDGKYKLGEKVLLADINDNGTKAPKITTLLSIVAGETVVVVCNSGKTTLPTFTNSNIETDINNLFGFPDHATINQTVDSGKQLPMTGRVVWTTNPVPDCKIYRSVAKLQLKVDLVAAGADVTGNFVEPQWNMYNVINEGYIHSLGGAFTAPTTELTFRNNTTLGKFPIGTSDKGAAETTLYLPESENSTKARATTVNSSTFHTDRSCLVVRVGTSVASHRFYRIDLYDKSTKTYIDIKRNNHYTVTIKEVRSEGYASIAEALANPGSNIEYTIDVTDGNGEIVASNGQYALLANHDEVFIFDNDSEIFEIAKVGFVAGLGLTPVFTINKISASGVTLTASTPKVVTTTMTPIYAQITSATGTGTITIKLGNITRTISVHKADRLPATDGSVQSAAYDGTGTWTVLEKQWRENGNDFTITSTATKFTLTWPANEKPVTRRFEGVITRQNGSTVQNIKVMGKQTAKS